MMSHIKFCGIENLYLLNSIKRDELFSHYTLRMESGEMWTYILNHPLSISNEYRFSLRSKYNRRKRNKDKIIEKWKTFISRRQNNSVQIELCLELTTNKLFESNNQKTDDEGKYGVQLVPTHIGRKYTFKSTEGQKVKSASKIKIA